MRILCGDHDFLEVFFNAQPPPPGYRYWILVRPERSRKWYPSAQPSQGNGGVHHGVVYIGPAQRYFVAIYLLTDAQYQQVVGYLKQRDTDNEWWRGFDLWEDNNERAGRYEERPCPWQPKS